MNSPIEAPPATVPSPSPAVTPAPDPYRTERMIGIITAVVVVGVVLYLVLRNQPIVDPNLVVVLRIVISLAVGILGATIPGFLGVEYTVGGIVIRAGGALALFVLTFFGTPQVSALKLADASVELDTIKQVDIRSSLGPDAPEEQRLNAPAYVTVPISLRSLREPSVRARLDSTEVSFSDANGEPQRFKWRSFVTMHEERHGVWLGIDGSAHPVAIESGDIFYREILHEPDGKLRWQDALQLIETPGRGMLEIKVVARLGAQVLEQSCAVDLNYWAGQLLTYKANTQAAPGRITMTCSAG